MSALAQPAADQPGADPDLQYRSGSQPGCEEVRDAPTLVEPEARRIVPVGDLVEGYRGRHAADRSLSVPPGTRLVSPAGQRRESLADDVILLAREALR